MTSSFATIPEGENSVMRLYTEGIKNALMEAPYETSASFFQRALVLDSLHAPSYYELANLFYPSQPTQALRYSYKANALDSTNVWYKGQLGRLLITTQQYDSALDLYRTLIPLAPSNPDNYRLLAALYEQQNQPFAALSVLDSAQVRFGAVEELTLFKRQLLISLKLYDSAINEAKSLIQNYPYNESYWVSLAELYALNKQDTLSLDSYRQALTINPKSMVALASLNEFYKNRGDDVNFLATAKQLFLSDEVSLETKILFFNDVLRTPDYYRSHYFLINDIAMALAISYPTDFPAQQLYANHLISSGKPNESLRLYKGLVNDTIRNLELFNSIMDLEAYLQHPDSVEHYATLALKQFPNEPELYLRKGSILSFYMKDYAGANDAFLRGLKVSKTDSLRSIFYGALGDNAHEIKQIKKSFSYYEKALNAYPDNASVMNNYAYFLSETGHALPEALRMSKRANTITPSNATYLDTQAWVLYKLGRYEEARTVMRQALSMDKSGSAELFLHYGDILYALNDPFMASVYWKKALEKGYDISEIEQRIDNLIQPSNEP